ncbi:hypothetical protein D9M70_608080 [compost metagenome]
MTNGYVSGVSVEFLLPESAAKIVRNSGRVIVGNVGGSERAVEAQRLTLAGVLSGVILSIQSKIRQLF